MENLILQVISAILQAIACGYFLFTFTQGLSNTIFSKKQKILATVCLLGVVILCIALKMILPETNVFLFVNTIIGALLIIVILHRILNVTKLKAFLSMICMIICFAISEILVVNTAKLLFNYKSLSDPRLSLAIVVLIFIFTHFASYIANKVTKPNLISSSASTKQLINIILLILVGIIPQIVVFAFIKYDYSSVILMITTLQIVLVSYITYMYFKVNIENEKSQSDLSASELHNKTLISMVDGVRTLKHDYNNIIQALNGYVSTRQYDKLQEHIDYVLKECNIVNNLSIIDPKIFNEPAIYGVVGAKYFLALERNISFELDIICNMQDIQFAKPELSRIIGILLDNAMEATEQAPEKYMRLEMKYDNRKNSDVIRVINTYDTNLKIDLNNIYRKGVSSKKVKSGIGLWEVKNLIKKQRNSQIYATIEGNKFVQNIIIEKIQ